MDNQQQAPNPLDFLLQLPPDLQETLLKAYIGGEEQDNPPQMPTTPSTPLVRVFQFEQLIKLVLYLHAVKETQSLARCLLFLDDQEERFQRQHIADKHRAALQVALNGTKRWPRPKSIPLTLLDALALSCVAVFDLNTNNTTIPNIESSPCLRPDVQKQFLDFMVCREEHAWPKMEILVNIHSALLNQSKKVPSELYTVLQHHDEFKIHYTRMQKRLKRLHALEC